jgi:hypothetical protein
MLAAGKEETMRAFAWQYARVGGRASERFPIEAIAAASLIIGPSPLTRSGEAIPIAAGAPCLYYSSGD